MPSEYWLRPDRARAKLELKSAHKLNYARSREGRGSSSEGAAVDARELTRQRKRTPFKVLNDSARSCNLVFSVMRMFLIIEVSQSKYHGPCRKLIGMLPSHGRSSDSVG